MSWAKIDDQLAFHAKILRAGNEAVGAWVRMLAHSCAHLTDGFIASGTALLIAPKKVVDRAVTAGLLDPDGADYRIHDFHDWNPTAEGVRAQRSRNSEVRARSGRSGGLISAAKRRSKREANGEANAKQTDDPFASALLKTHRSKNEAPSPSPVEREETAPVRSTAATPTRDRGVVYGPAAARETPRTLPNGANTLAKVTHIASRKRKPTEKV